MQQFKWVAKGAGGFGGACLIVVIFLMGHQPAIDLFGIPVQIIAPPNYGMSYKVVLANDSDTEATNFSAKCEIFLDNLPLNGVYLSIPANPTSVGAHEKVIVCGAKINATTYRKISNGGVFQIYIHAEYKGLAWSHSYCNKEQYSKNARMFADVGTCNASKPFPQ